MASRSHRCGVRECFGYYSWRQWPAGQFHPQTRQEDKETKKKARRWVIEKIVLEFVQLCWNDLFLLHLTTPCDQLYWACWRLRRLKVRNYYSTRFKRQDWTTQNPAWRGISGLRWDLVADTQQENLKCSEHLQNVQSHGLTVAVPELLPKLPFLPLGPTTAQRGMLPELFLLPWDKCQCHCAGELLIITCCHNVYYGEGLALEWAFTSAWRMRDVGAQLGGHLHKYWHLMAITWVYGYGDIDVVQLLLDHCGLHCKCFQKHRCQSAWAQRLISTFKTPPYSLV